MSHFYEKKLWTTHAKSYASYAYIFTLMCWIVGIIGLIAATVAFFVGLANFSDGGWAAILGAVVTTFQSILVIVFGMMMNGLSRIVLASFEMSVSETRQYLDAEQQNP